MTKIEPTNVIGESVVCGFTYLHGTPVLAIPPLRYNDRELKRVLGAMFLPGDPGTPGGRPSAWLFPGFVPYVFDVIRDLEIVLPNIEFSPELKEHLRHCENVAKLLAEKPVASALRPDFEFVTTPYEHQREALNFALHLYRCGIFYDMGLGKTKIVIDLIRHEREKALILSPVVGIDTWFAETALHSGGELNVARLVGTPKKKKALIEASSEYDVVVVGYDTAKRYYEQLINAFEYKIIVADESHSLRTGRSARTKGAVALSARAKRRILLSGTPSLGNPLHLWGQLKFLGKFIPARDQWAFRRFYTIKSKSNPKMIVGYKNLEMLNDKLSRVTLRRMKDECLDLPPRQIIDVFFDVNREQKKMYNELVEGACTQLENGEIFEAAHAATVIQKLMQILSGFFIVPPPTICDDCAHVQECVANYIKPFTKNCQIESTPRAQAVQRMKKNPKLDALEELLDSILAEERNKVIIWGYFIAELDIVQELLAEKKIRHVRVDGSNSSQAQQIAEEFNETPEIRVYLANIATGVALTLTSAAYMVYFGLTYKLDEYLQSMDRNYRIGQESKVVTYRLLSQGSVLDYVARALRQKADIAATLVDSLDCILCNRNAACLENGVQLFSERCLYKDRVKRVITHPQKL